METVIAPRPLFYTVETLASELGIDARKVRRMVESGYLPSRRLGRKVILVPEDIVAALSALSVTGSTRAGETAEAEPATGFSDN